MIIWGLEKAVDLNVKLNFSLNIFIGESQVEMRNGSRLESKQTHNS